LKKYLLGMEGRKGVLVLAKYFSDQIILEKGGESMREEVKGTAIYRR